MSLSLSFFVYRTERLSEAFHCRQTNDEARLILKNCILYVPHLNTIFLHLYNRTAKLVFPLQKTGDIYARKFTLIRKYEIKLNTIFESYYDSKAKSLSTYRFNIEHSDRYSGDSNSSSKRCSLGEPFSRQIRLKSSDMPESSQNGSASEISEIQDYDKAMGELINKVDDGTYVIAGQCLRDPKILQSYSHIPTIERKISFLHGTWRVMHEPKCVLEVSHCFVFQ